MKLIRSILELKKRVQVMGVLNLTPDSFSDGGEYNDVERAIDRAFEIEAEGADLIDIGGESTRPGSKPVSAAEELGRVMPVIERLQGKLRIPISIDTTKSEVAHTVIACGVEIINDISGLRFDPSLAEIAAQSGAGLILMHSRGRPETMQQLAPVADVFAEVTDGLRRSIRVAEQQGVMREKMIIDPGIGFGKTLEQNLQLINQLDRIVAEFDLPVLLGASRKSFIKLALDPIFNHDPDDERRQRMAGTAASVAIGVLRGARLVRVHDIRDMVVVVRITERILSASV
jgi:dihydropteroate synthase